MLTADSDWTKVETISYEQSRGKTKAALNGLQLTFPIFPAGHIQVFTVSDLYPHELIRVLGHSAWDTHLPPVHLPVVSTHLTSKTTYSVNVYSTWGP